MKTTKSLIEENKIKLDEAFTVKFPNGRYIIKIDRSAGMSCHERFPKRIPTKAEMENDELDIFLAKERGRRTSWCAKGAIVVTNRRDAYGKGPSGQVYTETFLNNTWGCVRYFADKSEFLACARKWGIPELYIEAFLALDTE